LPADQPFYALQIPGVEPGGVPLETIETLANFHLQHLRTVRPHGPYRLAGHSNGGIIAFELARQLEAAGESVEQLVIFDTTLADADDPSPLDYFSEVADVGGLLDIFGWDRKLAETLPLDAQGRLTDEPAVVDFVRRLLMENGMIPYNASPGQIARVVAVWRAAATAQAAYRPAGPVQAPITLFLARTVPNRVIRDEQRLAGWGWDRWTQAGLRIEVVPGNHVNLLLPPFVREVGQRLAQVLQTSG
jgi:thioesterase domain-containing protein